MTEPRPHPAITPLLVLIVAALITLQAFEPWESGREGPQPWPVAPVSEDGVKIGVTTEALARNSDRPWTPDDLVEVNDFEQRARRHADIVMWFVDWERGLFDVAQAEAVRARGSIPELSWEPWDSRVPVRVPQPRYQLSAIIAGLHDSVVRDFARGVAEYGDPVRIRFAQEMNGDAYPWAEGANGNREGEFVRAWRHVHAIFESEGATNARWIWAPVAGRLDVDQYPGDRFVDVVGASGFNGGTMTFRRRWRSFEAIFGETLDALHELAPDKPVAIPEVASAESGGSKAAWIRAMFDEVEQREYVRAVVWFNVAKEADWRISSSEAAQAAFARAVSTLRR